MKAQLSKEEIIIQLEKVGKEFSAFCDNLSDDRFFHQPVEKWSIAQNVTHLITSANMTKLAYRLPKFIVRWYTGKPNRPGRTYEELVAKYKMKLGQGGKASGRFVAKPVTRSRGKKNILQSYDLSMRSLAAAIGRSSDAQLDQYLAPHPLLGKLTLRELGYFTIYHTIHHLDIIKERAAE